MSSDLKTWPNTQRVLEEDYIREKKKRGGCSKILLPWAAKPNTIFVLGGILQRTWGVFAGATASVIYQVRAANWAVCQSLLLWLITSAAPKCDSRAESGIFTGGKKRNETDIWIPDWGMVKNRHNHTCGLSEMLIESCKWINFSCPQRARARIIMSGCEVNVTKWELVWSHV